MKQKLGTWLTRTEAETLLEVTPQQFANLREEGRIVGHPLPGLKRLAYRNTELLTLKQQLTKEVAG